MAKKALIAWGGWEGHTPQRSATVVRDMLERNVDTRSRSARARECLPIRS